MRYITLFFLAFVMSVCFCDAGITTLISLEAKCDSSELLSRKQVTVHNCDSAGEALAEAESRNPGWTAYNAKNVSGRTWVVSMKQS
jgi:hypothetical protein